MMTVIRMMMLMLVLGDRMKAEQIRLDSRFIEINFTAITRFTNRITTVARFTTLNRKKAISDVSCTLVLLGCFAFWLEDDQLNSQLIRR